jgi:hypothetical protein
MLLRKRLVQDGALLRDAGDLDHRAQPMFHLAGAALLIDRRVRHRC